MNGLRFDEGNDFVSLPQLHILAGLVGNQGFERKAAVKADAHQWTFAVQRLNVAEQSVARAALRRNGATLLQHDVLGMDGGIDFVARLTVVRGRCKSNQLLWPNLDGC